MHNRSLLSNISIQLSKHEQVVVFFLALLCSIYGYLTQFTPYFFDSHDFGRELFLINRISNGFHLYTDFRHYFGPLGHYAHSLFIGSSGTISGYFLANSSLLFVFFLLTYSIFRHFFSFSVSALTVLMLCVIISRAPDGSAFMTPYSLAHPYGLILSLAVVLFSLKFAFSVRTAAVVGFLCGLIALTKQEYLLFGMLFSIVLLGRSFLENRSIAKFFQLGFTLLAGTIVGFLIGTELTIGVSRLPDWFNSMQEAVSMFKEHEKSVLKNFLRLYSFAVIWKGLLPLALLTVLSKLPEFVRFQNLALAFGFSLGLLLTIDPFEFQNRTWLLVWSAPLFIFWMWKKDGISFFQKSEFLVAAAAMLFYLRQQNGSWLWSTLPFLSTLLLFRTVSSTLSSGRFIPLFFLIPVFFYQASNREFHPNPVFGPATGANGESLVYFRPKQQVIQQTLDYLAQTPDSSLYCGQEAGWLNVLSGRFNAVYNQQWWSYMEPEIMTGLEETPPHQFAIVYENGRKELKLFGRLNQIPDFIRSHYRLERYFETDPSEEPYRIEIYVKQ